MSGYFSGSKGKIEYDTCPRVIVKADDPEFLRAIWRACPNNDGLDHIVGKRLVLENDAALTFAKWVSHTLNQIRLTIDLYLPTYI